MANYWSTIHCLSYDWEKVVKCYWKRYPNPNSQHVFSEDFISAFIDEKGCLRTKRLITKTNKLPFWGENLFKQRNVWLIEESIVDPKTKIMRTYTRNLNLRLFMGTTERATFAPAKDAFSTQVTKEVWIESDIYGLRSAIKTFGIDRFKKNCVKATEGFNWVLERTY